MLLAAEARAAHSHTPESVEPSVLCDVMLQMLLPVVLFCALSRSSIHSQHAVLSVLFILYFLLFLYRLFYV